MWRYASVLPDADPVTLGEGWTPMFRSRRYPELFFKEEGANPSGSSMARGISLATAMARHYGFRRLSAACTGDSAGALAAYAAVASLEAHIFLSRAVSMADYLECAACGANVAFADGSVSDHGRVAAASGRVSDAFDLSAFKEPFRLEGMKTLGYELVEQLDWTYPDAVIYPADECLGFIGIWKAFDEMEHLGWVSGTRPKMVAVQVSASAPTARAWGKEATVAERVSGPVSFPVGIPLCRPNEDSLGLERRANIVRTSGGAVLDISSEEAFDSLLDQARNEGLLLCPEGAAAAAAYEQLLASRFLTPADRVVLFNTSSGLKHVDAMAEAMHLVRPGSKVLPQRTPVGGIITPA